MKRSPIKKVIILVSILAIPGFLFFYLLPQFAKNRYKSLPIFGEKIVASTFHSVKGKKIPDTIYHQIPDFKLVNQNGATLSWSSFKDKIVVLNLYKTDAISNDAVKYVKKLSESYEKKPLVRFVSLSVDPDDQSRVSTVIPQLKAVSGKWDLLTGDTAATYPLIRKGLLLDVLAEQSNFVYSNKVLLIDVQHRIRGIYEVDNQEGQSRLEDEIKVLIAEYLRTLKDGR